MLFDRIIRSTAAPIVVVGALAFATNATPALAGTTVQDTYGPGLNLLSNPGHEHPGVYFGGRGEINVTWSWVPFWEESPKGTDPRDQHYRTPEFRPVFASIYPDRVHSGGGSDRWFNFFALNHAAGIMQVVKNVPIGQVMRFTSWVQLWSSNVTSDPAKSTEDGNLRVRACIQTDGGPRNMVSPNLVCSDWAQPYDKWAQISVDATPISNTVLVLLQSNADIPVQHNDIYADDSCFEVLPASGNGICMGAGYVPSAIDAGAQPSMPDSGSNTAAAAIPVFTSVTVPAGDQPLTAANSVLGLNVRSDPSITTTNIIGFATRGQVFTVTGISADSKWFQITYNSKTGWFYASLTVPNAAAKAIGVVQ
ncbi:MAG: SH3 domain-containing protein [Chloroflexi bacterium]|nr:SH3 domain-containing protein [Chloroflexota bacterium]MCL5276019.1 SH3 domain-containing protein [Chloroflexota bacterium]